MEVIKKGRKQKGWSKKIKCTGSGNGGGGCRAILLVSEFDMYLTHSYHYDGSHDVYVTFMCPECGVETDVDYKNTPPGDLPDKKEWLKERGKS